jgi:hypothetical protein
MVTSNPIIDGINIFGSLSVPWFTFISNGSSDQEYVICWEDDGRIFSKITNVITH